MDKLKLIISLIAIFFGLTAIIGVGIAINNIELSIGLISLTFGLTAIRWTYNAMKSFSRGSSLKSYAIYFFCLLISILLSSIWSLLVRLYNLEYYFGPILLYPGYILITIAYIIILMATNWIISAKVYRDICASGSIILQISRNRWSPLYNLTLSNDLWCHIL